MANIISAESVSELLNNSDNSFESSIQIANGMSLFFNAFGSTSRRMKELENHLTKEGSLRLKGIISAIALQFAYERIKRGKATFDLRKEASEDFAYRNRGFFEEIFKRIYGFIPDTSLDKETFLTSIDRRDFEELQYVLGFLDKWINEHSTVKQYIFGGYVTGIVLENNPKYCFEKPCGYEDFCFPAI